MVGVKLGQRLLAYRSGAVAEGFLLMVGVKLVSLARHGREMAVAEGFLLMVGVKRYLAKGWEVQRGELQKAFC